ncbi:SDR family oxidoreductase [Planctomycetota bacterium]|nr:SDR family oxidoreductase [Planctomycetota bacterium]MDB4736318.1 SDR family oxidoreductase [Planctomycetota bacterium]
MRILIAGLGDLGAEVARLAAREGHDVLGLRRSAAAAPPGVALLRGDVTDPGSLNLPPEVDVVIYCVAAGARGEAAYREAYPNGLANVLDAIKASGSDGARVLFVSSTGVYGDAGGGWVDESTEPRPLAFTGRAMLAAEEVLRGGPFTGISLRLGGIYGPGRTFLPDAIRSGRSFSTATLEHWTNRIHRDDAARAILHIAAGADHPPVLNVVDPHPTRRSEVLTWLATQLAAELVVSTEASVPPGGGARPRSGDRRVSSRRLASTGFEFQYPSFREGYRELLGGDPGAHHSP